MTEWQKREWAFFLDESMELAYCEICQGCDKECKQSFRVVGIYCPYYETIKKEGIRERRKKRK
jgi:hypothetical protein